jgi:hypothetical protein
MQHSSILWPGTTIERSIPMNCRMCGGAAHPATGCAYSPTFIVCWSCTKDFWHWVKGWTDRKGRRKGPAFYDHVNRIAPPIHL